MRDKFFTTNPIPVTDLKLDLDNFRHYGQLQTQQDCFRIIINDNKEHFLGIAENIAFKGLTPQHIIVLSQKNGKWIVKDGNRRVVALKCLNNPSCCPDDILRPKIEKLANRYSDLIPSEVVCLGSEDEEAIYDYMELLHGGLLGGAGQKDWGPDGKTSFAIHRGRPAENAFAQALVNFVRDSGVNVSKSIYLTTLTRMLFKETRKFLGVDWDGQRIICADQDMLLTVMTRVITDIDNKKINVDTVRTWELCEKYLQKVLTETQTTPPSQDAPLGPVNNSKKEQAKETKPNPTTPIRPTPKPLWDRKHLIPSRTKVPAPPDGRARNAYIELKGARNIDVRYNPNAVAILFRTFIEWSINHYIDTHSPRTSGNSLKDHLWSVVLDLEKRGLISADQKLLLEKKKNHDEMISINSMNKWVHSENFHPSPQTLCMFWDEIEFFIVECWK